MLKALMSCLTFIDTTLVLARNQGGVIRGDSLAKVKVHAFYMVLSSAVGEEWALFLLKEDKSPSSLLKFSLTLPYRARQAF